MLTLGVEAGMFSWAALPGAMDSSLLGYAWFLIGALLLDLFDISLPRGDSVGVAGALSAAAIVVLLPIHATVIVMGAAVLAHFIRRGTQSRRRLFTALVSRAVGLLVGSVVFFGCSAAPPLARFCLVPAALLGSEIVATQACVALMSSRPFLRLLRGNLRSQLPVLAAEWSASVLLLLTYGGMSSWSLIPVVALLLLVRQSYALFLDIRETYRTTVEVLVEAAESQDARRIGHADRTAATARAIAMHLGFSSAVVEQVSYAALLHDLGVLAEQSTSEGELESRAVLSSDIVKGVQFFAAVEPILRVCDGGLTTDLTDQRNFTSALVVALASDIDAASSDAVFAAHQGRSLDLVAPLVPPATKAKVVAAALELGYSIPAVN